MAHNGSNGVSRAGPHQHSRAWQSFAPRRQSRGLSPRVGFQHGMSLEQPHIEGRLSQKSEKTGRQFRPKLRSSFSAVKDADTLNPSLDGATTTPWRESVRPSRRPLVNSSSIALRVNQRDSRSASPNVPVSTPWPVVSASTPWWESARQSRQPLANRTSFRGPRGPASSTTPAIRAAFCMRTRSASPARGTTPRRINRTRSRSASPASTPWNRDDKMKQGLARAIRVETLRYACFVVVMVVISM